MIRFVLGVILLALACFLFAMLASMVIADPFPATFAEGAMSCLLVGIFAVPGLVLVISGRRYLSRPGSWIISTDRRQGDQER